MRGGVITHTNGTLPLGETSAMAFLAPKLR